MDERSKDVRTTIVSAKKVPASERSGGATLLIALSGNSVGAIFNVEPRSVTVIGRDDLADIQIADSEVSRRHAALRYDPGSDGWLLSDLQSSNGTSLNGAPCEGEIRIQVGDKIKLGSETVLRVSLEHEAEAKYAIQMHHAALRDALTGAFNRRYLDERLRDEVAFAARHQAPLALLMLDIDFFKLVNDTYGHQAGDAVLRRFSEIVHDGVRTEDVVARYGGEEFAVLCRQTEEPRAVVMAERLRRATEKEPFAFDNKRIEVTVSIGVAGLLENQLSTAAQLVEAADKALYRCKSGGRNCWRAASR